MSYRKHLLGGVAVCAALALTAPAHAQSAGINSQMQALQQQIQQLNQQLQNLQAQINQQQQSQAQTQRSVDQMKAQAPAASGGGGIVASMPNNRPTLSTADGRNSISLTGRIHYDMGDYMSFNPQSRKTGTQDLNSGENLRRGRIGVLGKVASDWNFGLIYDFGGSNDSGPGQAGGTNNANSGGIEQAWLAYNGFKPFWFEAGILDLAWTLDEATSSNDIMFMERATPGIVAQNLAAGDFRSGVGGHYNTDRLWVGLYGTGGESGVSHANIGQQFGAVGRVTYQVLQSDNYSFHIGADAEGLIKPPTNGGVRSITSFSDRPELRIDTTQLLNTGQIGTAANPVTGASVFGAELAGGFGPLFGQAEYYHYNVARAGAPDLDFDGGYVEGSYTITGEHRRYIPTTGAYSGISPAHPFSIEEGTWGAWELAARYSVIDLNDLFTPGVTTTTNGIAVAGGHQEVITLGVNWYVNNNIRFMLDYLHGYVDKKAGTASPGVPLGTGTGGNFDAIALRTQVAW